jgi:small subunit ribosomal protein S6
LAQLQSLAEAPNTLREYETIYILNPDTLNDKVAEINDRVKTIIEERGGQVLNVDNWGKRKLAYEIKKERKGIYLLWQYLGSPAIVAEFERNMRIIDPIVRYLTIKLDTNVVAGSRESSVDGETYEKAASTAADEEEIMMQRSSSEGEASDGTEAAAGVDAAADETAAPEAEAAAEAAEAPAAEADAEASPETTGEEN